MGGSDLFSGMRGISKGTKLIHQAIAPHFDEVIAVNYNYFLDFGRALGRLQKYFSNIRAGTAIVLYGYSKGGDVVLQLARWLKHKHAVQLLVTVDVANGPWSHSINRQVSANVKKNINVYQSSPNFPLRSYGLPAVAEAGTVIKNINLTNKTISGVTVNHSNIEMLMVNQVIGWISASL